MITRQVLAFFLCVALGLARASGQSPTPSATPPAPPPGPLVVKSAADFAQWTVTTTSKPATASGGEQPKLFKTVLKVVKTGDLRHVTVVSEAAGHNSDTWCKGVAQVITRPEWKQPVLSTGENRLDAARLDFSSGDFAGFEWLKPENFVGIRKLAGRDCLFFQTKRPLFEGEDPLEKPRQATPPPPTDPGIPLVDIMAYTDLETRLPVALVAGAVTTAYQFGDAPTEKLVFPPELQAVIDTWNRKKQNMARSPAKP